MDLVSSKVNDMKTRIVILLALLVSLMKKSRLIVFLFLMCYGVQFAQANNTPDQLKQCNTMEFKLGKNSLNIDANKIHKTSPILVINNVKAFVFDQFSDPHIIGYYRWDGNVAVFIKSYPATGNFITTNFVVFKNNGADFYKKDAFVGTVNPVIVGSSKESLRVRFVNSFGRGNYVFYNYSLNDNKIYSYEEKFIHPASRVIRGKMYGHSKVYSLLGRIVSVNGSSSSDKYYKFVLKNPVNVSVNGYWYTAYHKSFSFSKDLLPMGYSGSKLIASDFRYYSIRLGSCAMAGSSLDMIYPHLR